MGALGFTSNYYKFTLSDVYSYDLSGNKILVYDTKNNDVVNKPIKISTKDIIYDKDVEKIKVEFLTTTRLQFNNDIVYHVNDLTPEIFIKVVWRRLITISAHFCKGSNENINHNELNYNIKITEPNIYFQKYKRYSHRQNQEYELGWLKGKFFSKVN